MIEEQKTVEQSSAVEEKLEDKKPNTGNGKIIKLILIIFGILIILGVGYRINAYFKYKTVQLQYENQLKQINQIQNNILEQQKQISQ